MLDGKSSGGRDNWKETLPALELVLGRFDESSSSSSTVVFVK
jgi:hypothetical protein